jgi:quercetin dioxygenase-like cupin family protein
VGDLRGVRVLPLTERPRRHVAEWESQGVVARPLIAGAITMTHLRFQPGGRLGVHPTSIAQVFVVVQGSGWVSGGDGMRERVEAGTTVLWEKGEKHASGSDVGMIAVVIQADALEAAKTGE